jgi:hypothetical protein
MYPLHTAPCPFNIVAIILELCIFLIYRKAVDEKFPDCSSLRKLEASYTNKHTHARTHT